MKWRETSTPMRCEARSEGTSWLARYAPAARREVMQKLEPARDAQPPAGGDDLIDHGAARTIPPRGDIRAAAAIGDQAHDGALARRKTAQDRIVEDLSHERDVAPLVIAITDERAYGRNQAAGAVNQHHERRRSERWLAAKAQADQRRLQRERQHRYREVHVVRDDLAALAQERPFEHISRTRAQGWRRHRTRAQDQDAASLLSAGLDYFQLPGDQTQPESRATVDGSWYGREAMSQRIDEES